MKKAFVAMSLGALVALPPLGAMAQSVGSPGPMQVAQAGTAHAGGGGSYKRHMRYSRNASRERARAGAEHMRQMRMAPAAPKS
jgi:hypothetical protein